MKSVKIIAEAGVNHNGERDTAVKLIDAAKSCGADVVKFQIFNSREMTTSFAEQAKYQIKNTTNKESQQSMLERLELSYEDFEYLYEYSKSKDILFFSTAFDFLSLNFIINTLKLDTLKIASGEITNAPFVLEHARSKRNLIVSTGMSTIPEIIDSLGVIAFGLTSSKNQQPKKNSFAKAFRSKAGQESLLENVTLLHCVTDYPAAHGDLNLNVIKKFKNEFKMTIGYSDHSDDIFIPSLAVACGAELIEKHITLNQKMKGPDHKASLEPKDFVKMVDQIRETENILGLSEKIVTNSEIENRKVSRKSLYAGKVIKEGEMFTKDNISIKRPESGRNTYDYWSILGRASKKDYKEGDTLDD